MHFFHIFNLDILLNRISPESTVSAHLYCIFQRGYIVYTRNCFLHHDHNSQSKKVLCNCNHIEI